MSLHYDNQLPHKQTSIVLPSLDTITVNYNEVVCYSTTTRSWIRVSRYAQRLRKGRSRCTQAARWSIALGWMRSSYPLESNRIHPQRRTCVPRYILCNAKQIARFAVKSFIRSDSSYLSFSLSQRILCPKNCHNSKLFFKLLIREYLRSSLLLFVSWKIIDENGILMEKAFVQTRSYLQSSRFRKKQRSYRDE